jgi:hypothetical protein
MALLRTIVISSFVVVISMIVAGVALVALGDSGGLYVEFNGAKLHASTVGFSVILLAFLVLIFIIRPIATNLVMSFWY